MPSRSTVLRGTAAVVGLLVVTGAALGAYALAGGFEEPTVTELDMRWGEVTEDTSEIRATVVVANPNLIGIPAIIGIEYTTSLNDVVIADGEKNGVGLARGTTEIDLSIPVSNERITAWWVTHINGAEQSTLAIDATVTGPFGFSMPLPTQRDSFQTDMLGSLGSDEGSTVSLLGEPFLIVGERSAEWGDADAETTPLTMAAHVTNEHDHPVTFDGVGYAITMNGIPMGDGVDDTTFTVAPGETETLTIRAALETQTIDEWWVSHLNADERTTLTVETFALVDRGDDEDPVQLSLLTIGLDLETDLLGGGEATTGDAVTETGAGLDAESPTVDVSGLAWGEVTDDETEVAATLEIDNPNEDSAFSQLVNLSIRQTVAINDVPVADDTTTVGTVASGRSSAPLSVFLDNAKVPAWWARHVNNGETSTVAFGSMASVDVGVTAFDLAVPGEDRAFETDLLADMNGERNQAVTVGGQPTATLASTSATWGEADEVASPIDATVTLRNDRQFVDVTVSDIDYLVRMNDVTVADGTDPASVTIPPHMTESLAFTMILDSTAMDDWWVSHLRNGERTTVTVEVTATVSAGGESERMTFDFLGGNTTIETDILGDA